MQTFGKQLLLREWIDGVGSSTSLKFKHSVWKSVEKMWLFPATGKKRWSVPLKVIRWWQTCQIPSELMYYLLSHKSNKLKPCGRAATKICYWWCVVETFRLHLSEMTSLLSALVTYSKCTVCLERGHLDIVGCIRYIIIKKKLLKIPLKGTWFSFPFCVSCLVNIFEVLQSWAWCSKLPRGLWIFCYCVSGKK